MQQGMSSGNGQRRVLVTGGASGIGYAVAKALLDAGAWVALADVNQDMLTRAARSLGKKRLLPINMDVTSASSVSAGVQAAAAKFKGLDTLVNCAGVIDFGTLDTITEARWDRVL